MTAKQYLGRVHHLRRQCESLERKIMLLRAKAEGLRAITYDKDKVMASPTNTIEEAVTELVNLEGVYRDYILMYSDAIATLIKQINGMEDQRHVEILTLRYIEERKTPDRYGRWTLSWMDIAKKAHMSYSVATKLHGEALKAFAEKYLQEDEKNEKK